MGAMREVHLMGDIVELALERKIGHCTQIDRQAAANRQTYRNARRSPKCQVSD